MKAGMESRAGGRTSMTMGYKQPAWPPLAGIPTAMWWWPWEEETH